jgi:hypothetical protein
MPQDKGREGKSLQTRTQNKGEWSFFALILNHGALAVTWKKRYSQF